MKATTSSFRILRKAGASELLPSVSSTDNKARRGKSLIMAGSHQYPGAGVLAAKSALRMGSGYVILAQKNPSVSAWDHPDFLLCDLSSTDWHTLNYQAVLVGPGFGVNDFTASVIEDLKKRKVENVVLDADAITVCAERNLFPLPPSWIMTPHTGELSRCLKVESAWIDQNREAAIKQAHALTRCVVLLKGHHTLIHTGNHIYMNKTGNAALAKSGTGDVLAGIIVALRAQGLSAGKAAVLGAYVHGATANLWKARGKDLLSMTASDVIEILPEVLFKLRN